MVGTGDFNSDGISDLLWRSTSGVNALWEMNANGTIKAAFNMQSVDVHLQPGGGLATSMATALRTCCGEIRRASTRCGR